QTRARSRSSCCGGRPAARGRASKVPYDDANKRDAILHETMTEPTYHPAGGTDLPEGQMRAIKIAGRDIVLCRTKEGWYALDDVCTHAFARMSEGRLRGFRLI